MKEVNNEKDRKITDEYFKIKLSPEQYHVLREKGTELPFTGKYVHTKDKGMYTCAACGQKLFSSDTKFDSETGWPSFTEPANLEHIKLKNDFSNFMVRTEVMCKNCGSHLGHVFNDGPKGKQRYCINSCALNLEKNENDKKDYEIAIFAAGCFWGVEEIFRTTRGVISTEVGYTGGNIKNPKYILVCTGITGHAEAVKIEYDSSIISYKELLEIFWENHNPTTKNRQGFDIGSQYRSAIFYTTEEQKKDAEQSKEGLEKSKKWKNPIVTVIGPAMEFYSAEEYHQKYLMKKGLASCHM